MTDDVAAAAARLQEDLDGRYFDAVYHEEGEQSQDISAVLTELHRLRAERQLLRRALDEASALLRSMPEHQNWCPQGWQPLPPPPEGM